MTFGGTESQVQNDHEGRVGVISRQQKRLLYHLRFNMHTAGKHLTLHLGQVFRKLTIFKEELTY